MTLPTNDPADAPGTADAAVDGSLLLERAQQAIDLARQMRGNIEQADLGLERAVQRAKGEGLRAEAEALRAAKGSYRNLLLELRDEIDGLRKAMNNRATIEQAKGILMASEHCTPEAAFDILVRASQRENRKLAMIAVDIVQRAVAGGHGGDSGSYAPAPPQRQSAPPR